jgi:hypothetical protein
MYFESCFQRANESCERKCNSVLADKQAVLLRVMDEPCFIQFSTQRLISLSRSCSSNNTKAPSLCFISRSSSSTNRPHKPFCTRTGRFIFPERLSSRRYLVRKHCYCCIKLTLNTEETLYEFFCGKLCC